MAREAVTDTSVAFTILTIPMVIGAASSSVLFWFYSKDCSHPLGAYNLACYLLGGLGCLIYIVVQDKMANGGNNLSAGIALACWVGSVLLYFLAARAFFKVRLLTPTCRRPFISFLDWIMFLFGLVSVMGYSLFSWFIIIRNTLERKSKASLHVE